MWLVASIRRGDFAFAQLQTAFVIGLGFVAFAEFSFHPGAIEICQREVRFEFDGAVVIVERAAQIAHRFARQAAIAPRRRPIGLALDGLGVIVERALVIAQIMLNAGAIVIDERVVRIEFDRAFVIFQRAFVILHPLPHQAAIVQILAPRPPRQ